MPVAQTGSVEEDKIIARLTYSPIGAALFAIRAIKTWRADSDRLSGTGRVCIFHAGGDGLDRQFAEKIAHLLSSFSTPQLIDVGELEAIDDIGAFRSEAFHGVPVLIVSPAMLRPAHYRTNLLTATPRRNIPGHATFYICRGITTAEIRESFPELEDLFGDVMVGEETDMSAMVAEIRSHLSSTHDRVSSRTRATALVRRIAVTVLLGSWFLAKIAYVAAFPCALWLVWSLLITGGHDFELVASCDTLFAAGYAANRIPALDLWPWLGSGWAINNQLGGHADANRTARSFLDALGPWQRKAETARNLQFSAVIWLATPGTAALWGTNWAWAGLTSLATGLALLPVASLGVKEMRRVAYWSIGMKREEMDRPARFSRLGSRLSGTALDYRWEATRGGARILRSWRQRAPRAFVSYAWCDEERTSAARTVWRTISSLGVDCFLDSERLVGKFSAWRRPIVEELLKCSHVVVVLGPSVRDAHVFHDEIRFALQRWYFELEPAVLCVVEPEIADGLRSSKLSGELEYLLDEAPKLTYAEAESADLVGHLLFQRRRQGLLKDWVTLLRPERRLQQFLQASR